ncbi:TolC family protein [uncultured Mucilaginibacter sp.]|uniref:TolC family protein n=1 Tax=uncultured Mucilaginibacter sp. TaxID=797541 RepID=UPI0025DDC9D9|nr:TolC family protein [uncultured Mucilaginibacter sp.]
MIRSTKFLLKVVSNLKKQLTGFAIILLLLRSTIPAFAQTTVSLRQAISSALANRKNIQAGKMDLTIRKLQTEALLKKYWPQVSVEYNYLYNPILQTSILPIGIFNPAYPVDATKSIQFGTKWSQAAGVTVVQPLLDVSISRQKSESELQERIAVASQLQSEYELVYDVAQAYANIGLQQEQIGVAIADTARTWISYQLQKNKFLAKRLLKSDLNTALINHHNTLQKLADAVSQLVENKVYLLFLIGQDDVAHADIAIDMSLFKNNNAERLALVPMNDSIPELQQLALQSKLAALQAETEKAKYLPTISMKGFLGANQYTNQFSPIAANSWFGLSYVGLDVKLPLLIGEDKQNKLQQLKLQSYQYNDQRDDKYAGYVKDAVTAKIKTDRLLAQLKTLNENISLSKETIQIMQDRFDEGQETASTLNTEEVSLESILANYALGEKQLWIFQLDYLKATGRLNKLWQ